ncbi:MAG: hypothetical protein ACI9NQ_000413 [Paracoccaceae bacterium]|jgi:hypothetical protein
MPTQNELLANVVRLYRGQEPEFEHGSEEKLKEVFGASRAYQDVPGLCKPASRAEIEAQGWSLNPGLGKDPPDQARRRITDVVNRSGAEMDTPQEGPQGEAKPESNGHGYWRRDSTHALTIRPTNGRLVLKIETL